MAQASKDKTSASSGHALQRKQVKPPPRDWNCHSSDGDSNSGSNSRVLQATIKGKGRAASKSNSEARSNDKAKSDTDSRETAGGNGSGKTSTKKSTGGRALGFQGYSEEDTLALLITMHTILPRGTNECCGNPSSYKFYSNYSSNSGSSSASGGSSSSGSDLSQAAATPSPTITTTTSSSSVGIGTIIGIAAVAVVVVVVVVAFLILRKKRVDRSINAPSPVSGGGMSKDSYAQELLGQHTEGTTASTEGSRPSHNATESLWNDEVIVAARIPREKVLMHERISRGGFGEVYVGVYNGRKVAIKMLLPEIRKRIQSVNEFLAEVKLMAALEHPRIVEFIGVAWDSLTDLCVVSELMERGDLRALLSQFQAENHPHGFDHDKVKIALHVAHALTYMHSFSPPIVHRDLKSKNILLTDEFDAKLTDFGASRERVDRTMTAGVGTSLWMAPEIMAGEKYDEKADMFSFAVVLSELDSHVLPYTKLRQETRASDVAILQLVLQGKTQIDFSDACPSSIAALGMACAAKDPTARPTAAQALYELQQALNSNEFD